MEEPAAGCPVVDVGPVAHGGHCVARLDGRVVFVRHALPGERVRLAVTEDRGRYLRADAVEVVGAPSPDRVEPPCPHARPGRCGGCDWQHASLVAQRRLKAAVVAEQLARLAGVAVDVVVEPLPDADPERPGLDWRTRVQLAVAPDARLGLRVHRSHEVVPVDECRIAHPAVDDLGVLRRPWPGASAVEVVVGSTGDRAVVVSPAGRDDPVVPPLDGRASVLLDRGGAPQPLRGRPGVRQGALGRVFRVSGSGFWQVHPAAAEVLTGAVLDALQPAVGESALDLYGGAGLFAAALATAVGAGGQVTVVEADAGAAADAEHNLRDLPQARVEAGDVSRVLARSGLRHADLVVLDPPRSGAGADVVRRVAGLGPRAIAYVACDPAALARDVATFQAVGYRLERLRAFDCFPMTHHVECVALLVPASPNDHEHR